MNYFVNRREKLGKHLNHGELMVFFAGEPQIKSADAEYEFQANRNYYYLTGLNEPEGILLMYKIHQQVYEQLLIRAIDPNKEKWIGRFIQPQEAQKISGVEKMGVSSDFHALVSMLLTRVGIDTIYLDHQKLHFHDSALPSDAFLTLLKQDYPLVQLKNSFPLVAKLRTIKDDLEIQAIREACALTNQAIERAAKSLKPNQYEYEAMAEFLYVLNRHNATEMFDTIMASGENGVILHYVENNHQMKENDLVLYDLGAKLNQYGADISRTYPVSGRYTERQKQLYNIVLEAQNKVTAAVKPGVTLAQLNQIVVDYYGEKLQEIGLIKDQSEVSRYYYHSVGHFLGLDTHDVGYFMNQPLEAGNVITNEPGLYIAEEKIGIRIETDLLVTEDGCEDLAPMIKKTVEDIEAMMAK